MLSNRRFKRGSDISSLIAGLLPLPVWQQMDAQVRGDANGNTAAEQLTYIIEKVYEVFVEYVTPTSNIFTICLFYKS